MPEVPHRRFSARSALAVAAALALGGCLSAPRGPTSAGAIAPPAGNVSIQYVTERYIESTHFRRIAEYFTGVEDKSGRVIERTRPDNRTGYYFIVDLNWKPGVVLPAGTKAELDYVRADNPRARHAEFVFSTATGTFPEILLGLTGLDWPNPEMGLVAYKLTLQDASGQTLAEHESFLWALPPGAKSASADAASPTGSVTAAPAPTAPTAASAP